MAISVPSITEERREQKLQLLDTVEMKRLRWFSQIRRCARGESRVRIGDVGPDFNILLAGSEEIALTVVGRSAGQAAGYLALQVVNIWLLARGGISGPTCRAILWTVSRRLRMWSLSLNAMCRPRGAQLLARLHSFLSKELC